MTIPQTQVKEVTLQYLAYAFQTDQATAAKYIFGVGFNPEPTKHIILTTAFSMLMPHFDPNVISHAAYELGVLLFPNLEDKTVQDAIEKLKITPAETLAFASLEDETMPDHILTDAEISKLRTSLANHVRQYDLEVI